MTRKLYATICLSFVAVMLLSDFKATEAQMDHAHSGPVMNYHRIDERLVTGGHLIDDGAAALGEQGIDIVIDLRDDSPRGEAQRFAEHGIRWVNVPVEWSDPRPEDFQRFAELMNEHRGEHVLVQCAANYRASAMTYLYRVVVEGVPEEKALADMRAIWNPDENRTWRAYISDIKEAAPE